MKPFIVVGDKTSHGGVVIEGSPTNDIDGKAIARVGDKVTCPKKGCHSPTVIVVSGDVTIIVDGKPVALHGDKTACGATLISSQFNTNSDPTGDGGGGSSAGAGGSAIANAAASSAENQADYDEQFQLHGADGQPLVNAKYKIVTASGSIFEGVTDDAGKTQRVKTPSAEQLHVYLKG